MVIRKEHGLILIFLMILNSCKMNNEQTQRQNIKKIALEESAKPIRPGIPGKRPFWNIYSKRFIYAPTFDFEEIENAISYRFSMTTDVDSQVYVFESKMPWNPLTPIWLELPNAVINLQVFALDENGKVIRKVGERKFLKSPFFEGVSEKPAFSYKKSGIKSLQGLLKQDKIQYWLKNGKPDPSYPLWVHPTKIMGAVAIGMIHLADISKDTSESSQAHKMALIAADFLLSMIEPEGRPLEYWPPTYWDGVPREAHPVYHDEIMTHYPAEGAMMFLDMYDYTNEEKYYNVAKKIADTYIKTQESNGTWSQIINTKAGEAISKNWLIPTKVIEFFNRLIEAYGLTQYENVRDRAFSWCLKNPVKTFNWQAQFEDTRPKPPYKNMSKNEAVEMAILLLDRAKENKVYVELAKEILRYAEDQFIVWSKNDPVLRWDWFKKDSKWNGTTRDGGCDWFVPCALEQYKFYTPIGSSNRLMVIVFLKFFEVTGQAIYHAKAEALANTLIIAQNFHGGGEIPTHLRRNLPELNWINCGVYPALTLIMFDEILNQEIQY